MERAPLVGRTTELEALTEALSEAEAGRGRVVLIEGEAGIGKSRLIDEIVNLARHRDFEILTTKCDESERTVPFAAARRVFARFGSTHAASAGEPAAAAKAAATQLVSGGAGWTGETVGSAQQFLVTEGFGNLVEAAAANGPLLVAFDDLQWADASTVLTIRSIATRIDPLPVLLVGTSRPEHTVRELHRLTDDLTRTGAMMLSLGPLAPDEVASLVAALVGRAPDGALMARLRGAAGNPLYLSEYIRASAEIGGGTTTASAVSPDESRVPLEFRRRVLRRLEQLVPEVGDAIRLASVLGSTFTARDLAVALGCSVVELAPLIEQARAADVIAEREQALAFKHDLVRVAVYDHIPDAMRRALHREVGFRLAGSGADALTVAHHLSLGAEATDPEAAAWLRRAAGDASQRAPAVAAELLERARELLPAMSPDHTGVLTELVMAYAWSGNLSEAEELSSQVLGRTLEPATANSLRSALVRALTWQGQPAVALRRAGLAPDEDGDGPGLDLLAAETALAALFAFDLPRAIASAARAEAEATRSGNELALCQALSVQVFLLAFTGRPYEAVELGRRANAIADASASAHLAHPRFFPGMPLVMLDRLDEAETMLREGMRYAEERGLVWCLPLYHSHLGCKRFVAGQWDAAVAELEAGLAIADELNLATAPIHAAAAWLAVIQLHRDDVSAAEATIAATRARPGHQSAPLVNWAAALLHEARGEVEQALALLQGAWDTFMNGGGVSDPFSSMALVSLCARSGDDERALALLPVVYQQAEIGKTPFLRGQALRCRGLATRDADALVEAVTQYRLGPRPLDLAGGCEDAGTMLARSGRLDEGVPLLEEALRVYADIGARRDVARVRAVLRQHGVRRSPYRQRNAADRGWESLTPTELKVVELVAQRLSNPEVAERLFISRHTVESHLKHIYRKLAVTSRVELAKSASARN